jgi:hypothetical protein
MRFASLRALSIADDIKASYIEPDWQKSFFGENYAKYDHHLHVERKAEMYRLLTIKERYDPNNTLWCHPCVGSEKLKLGNDGKLYYIDTSPETAVSSETRVGIARRDAWVFDA